ncbi:C3a anaphylatoxin chemotactic receptor-like [Leptodactylus fuscus]|uniref:C3a anaphylatoxin chemotactic receptor-like n=1 Tax=Leptodactylus fuscus TaxID=238119 RepID=UPI003F4E5286
MGKLGRIKRTSGLKSKDRSAETRTPDNKTSDEDRSWRDVVYIFQKVYITLFSLIFVLGIIGNGLVIWIAGFRMKKTISAAWFLSLAIADFLCCTSIPLQIAQWAEIFKYPNIVVCLFTVTLFTLNMFASVFLLTAMSIDRCVSVMWPFWARAHRTRTLVRIIAGGVWLLSFILTGSMVYVDHKDFDNITEWCSSYRDFNYTTNLHWRVEVSRLLVMFVIPFLIILTSYVIIVIKVRKSNRPQRSQRPYRIIIAIVLCFFICWCPYYILPFVFSKKYGKFYTELTIITVLAYLSSCLNPIIYVFIGQNIKADFFRSILIRLERALTEHPDDLSREPEDGNNTLSTDL